MYRFLFSRVLTKLDPEFAHHVAFDVIRSLPRLRMRSAVARFTAPRDDISVRTLGLEFPTPFGLAAGFDKDARGILGLGALGFGHIEVGTVTAHAQPGNPKPRMFRLTADRALINRMGFNNGGSVDAAERIRRVRSVAGRPIIGANIGKSRVTDVDDAIGDYLASTRALASVADYLVVNVSSPNTPGLRDLQAVEKLEPLLTAVKAEAEGTPLLLKLAPDLADDEIEDIAALVLRLGLDGLVVTNTTISREGLSTPQATVASIGAGGLSGAPLAARSLEVLRLVRRNVPDDLCVISVGGIESAEDVAERLDAGATLVQGYTGFIYNGPLWVRAINRGLRGRR
jgi:dihydroorotate dehydrogenase